MILAAGRGERMRPLTDAVPKPLLEVGGRKLIEYHLYALARANIREIVINTSHLAEQFEAALGDGARYDLRIAYSYEGPSALETGGGIQHALPLLGDEPFVVVNGDIYCDYDYSHLTPPRGLAHLILVDNPAHNPAGDFVLRDARVMPTGARALTFSGIGVYRRALFDGLEPGAFALAPVLRDAITHAQVSGEHYRGFWSDVGTPTRLRELEHILQQQQTTTSGE